MAVLVMISVRDDVSRRALGKIIGGKLGQAVECEFDERPAQLNGIGFVRIGTITKLFHGRGRISEKVTFAFLLNLSAVEQTKKMLDFHEGGLVLTLIAGHQQLDVLVRDIIDFVFSGHRQHHGHGAVSGAEEAPAGA